MNRYSQGLLYEWTFNNNLVDDVQCVVLSPSGNVQFVNESTTLSSVYLANGAYLYAPTNIYFQNVFTITAWFYPIQFTSNARLLDFGCGSYSWNIILCYAGGGSQNPFFETYSGGSSKGQLTTSTSLAANKWNHLAAVLDSNNKAYLYINGTLANSRTVNPGLINSTRTKNYVGKSNWNDGETFAKIKNLRIYNIALDANAVKLDMDN